MFERYFIDDDGTLLDRTIEYSTPYTSTGAWDAKSYLYVSSYFPFNHKYFDVTTANDQAGTLSVDVWYNDQWTSVVDIIDDTISSGKSFAKSGNIYFTIDDLKGWDIEDDSSDITELSTTKVYRTYWARFGFDASVDSSLVLNYVGHKFCDDNALFAFYPVLNNTSIMTQFKTGKTNWIEQEISASGVIEMDLKSRNLIISKDQILDVKRFEMPCVHKTAELIFAALGSAYLDDKNEAKKSYNDVMNTDDFGIDRNANGQYDRFEKRSHIKRMGR